MKINEINERFSGLLIQRSGRVVFYKCGTFKSTTGFFLPLMATNSEQPVFWSG